MLKKVNKILLSSFLCNPADKPTNKWTQTGGKKCKWFPDEKQPGIFTWMVFMNEYKRGLLDHGGGMRFTKCCCSFTMKAGGLWPLLCP